MSVKNKTETLQEFLARGGSIKKLPTGEMVRQVDVAKQNVAGNPAVILSLEDADLFYGEAKKNSKPKKVKTSSTLDINALPEALRVKFLNKLKEEVNDEDFKKANSEEDEEGENS